LVFWTENGIRKVAAEVAVETLSGGKGAESARKHVSDLLRGSVTTEVGNELRATAETLAEAAKASLHRKLNAIYTAHCERLEQKLKLFEVELEKREPDQQQRLEQLERRLAALEVSCEEWLESPKQQLERAAAEHQQAFSEELHKLAKNSEAKVKGIITRVERQVADLVQERLHNSLLEAVREHVASTPFEPDGLSNKQIATGRRISIRQVKRLRRLGLA
jgi:DNA anti-recombination protein RmuC